MKLNIETYWVTGGMFQLKIKKSWDGSYYIECGGSWRHSRGFGHPIPGRHVWRLEDGKLQQESPGSILGHYPITVNANVANLLKECNSVINPSPPTCVVEGIEIRRDTHAELRREGIDIHRARNDANIYAMSLASHPPNKILAAFREQEEVRQQEKAEDAYWEW